MTKKPNKNTHFEVRNLKGTSRLKRCRCGSWIKHWKKHTHSQRTVCAVHGCIATAQVGAHVVSVDKRTNQKWWIAPFCSMHNNWRFTKPVYLNKNVTLVSANKKYTCR